MRRAQESLVPAAAAELDALASDSPASRFFISSENTAPKSATSLRSVLKITADSAAMAHMASSDFVALVIA